MVKRIGVMTGGGDCPGLNAVLRAVVKTAMVKYGYDNLLSKTKQGLVLKIMLHFKSDVSGSGQCAPTWKL